MELDPDSATFAEQLQQLLEAVARGERRPDPRRMWLVRDATGLLVLALDAHTHVVVPLGRKGRIAVDGDPVDLPRRHRRALARAAAQAAHHVERAQLERREADARIRVRRASDLLDRRPPTEDDGEQGGPS